MCGQHVAALMLSLLLRSLETLQILCIYICIYIYVYITVSSLLHAQYEFCSESVINLNSILEIYLTASWTVPI